jgi:hypothetical protein
LCFTRGDNLENSCLNSQEKHLHFCIPHGKSLISSNAGGGGEKVLFCMLKSLEKKDMNLIIYSGKFPFI